MCNNGPSPLEVKRVFLFTVAYLPQRSARGFAIKVIRWPDETQGAMSSRTIKNRLMVGAAALPVLLAGPAMAAPQTYNWAGFYAGLHGGGAWSSTHQTTTVPCTEPLGTGYICATALPLTPHAAGVGAAYSGSFSGSGFTGGVQAGYNWQTGAAVYGVELDLESLPRVSAQRAGAL